MPTPYLMCFVTVGDEKTASRIAQGLVEGKLAACVNVIGKVSSFYRWQRKVEKSPECLLIIKTRKNLLKDVEQFVKRKHTYTVPEILFLNIDDGNREYLNWLGANTLFTANIPKDKSGKNIL
ncbi:MAG: divalent-cation tolerance protein CutA [Elusimicrobia bacterium]|nr:divalent-cation tolerance protein CutA [Elusimicrobiota bacterium]